MSKQNNALTTEAFTKEQINEYKTLTTALSKAQKQGQELETKQNGLLITISSSLARIKKRELFKIGGYNNIYDYAKDLHGISRGGVSNSIAVLERFGNEEQSAIADRYSDYTFKAMVMLKAYSDAEIEEMGIIPQMSCTEIAERIKALKSPDNNSTVEPERNNVDAMETTPLETQAEKSEEEESVQNDIFIEREETVTDEWWSFLEEQVVNAESGTTIHITIK